ncbi:hypothetical protein RND81_02G053800 [Saponaria officinalis]|uniref:non-specific serine/threonine protein kinase n=1 Tax=Saponaria officinalis TaxID=3572 RepID=A0AAW1MN01_SAPOF
MPENNKESFLNNQLSTKTSILGLKLWVLIVISILATLITILFLISLYTFKRNCHRRRRLTNIKQPQQQQQPATIPNISKEITEIRVDNSVPDSVPEQRMVVVRSQIEENPGGHHRIHIEIGKNHRMAYPASPGDQSGGGGGVVPEVSHLGWGHWYTLRELEECTNGFADENVIGEGGYGIVYHGVFEDDSHVAVKNLLNNRGQAEKEFKVEVEAIGRVRHKNLVRLLGYCAEGAHRILVYEYVDNGNLEQWLHGDVGPTSPLTWDIRMNILVGTAKGLTYLHEGLEPKVVHRDIKSSNILLDKHWNSKVSDFGLAKLLGSELSYVTTRVMGTFGYVAPEYANTGMLNERSDVYSFGILLMEIISGRNPVDYSRPPGEVNLVDWIKQMVSSRNTEGIIDPKLAEKPPSRALKRVLLVALRCVDPNAQKRPKMGHVVHMLEAEEFPFRDDRRGGREHAHSDHSSVRERMTDRRVSESGDSSGYESGARLSRLPLRKSQTVEED